jgi:pyruvate,water dikinase
MGAMEDHWRWRVRMAKQLASELDGARYGVTAIYLTGSSKNATAGPASDIDLIVRFHGSPEQKDDLQNWLQLWSMRLAQMNFERTRETCDGLLDVHWVTEEDIARRTSFAIKIGAVTDAAMPLLLKSGQ